MKRSFQTVNSAILPIHKNIIVIGGGTSVNKSKHIISLYIKDKNPLVISANRPLNKYNLNIDAQYMVFLDYRFFNKYKNEIKNTNLVIGTKIYNRKEEVYVNDKKVLKSPKKLRKLYNFYLSKDNNILLMNYKREKSKFDKIKINNNGYIPHFLGSAGFASILLASMMKPKEIFICGFDGVSKKGILRNSYSNQKYSRMWEKNFNPIESKKMLVKIIKYLKKKKIKIITSKHDRLWGINKKNFGIQIR